LKSKNLVSSEDLPSNQFSDWSLQGIKAKYPGMKPCLDLATAQAVSNADQYVYFVQNLMALKYPEKMRSYRGSGNLAMGHRKI